MFDPTELDKICQASDSWQNTTLRRAIDRQSERGKEFTTISGEPVERLERVRGERDNVATQAALRRLEDAARDQVNLMPPILEAVHTYASLGEIMGVLRRVFGEYREPIIV